MAEKIDELYVEIRAKTDKLEAELNSLRNKMNKKGLTLKANFDSAVAKMKISELEKLHVKLKNEWAKKISMNVDAASLERTRIKLASVETALKGVKAETPKLGNIFSSTFSKIAASVGVMAVIHKALNFVTEAKNAARDAEEIGNKFNTVFSSISKDANNLAKNFSSSFRLANTTAKELLSSTGDILVGFGFNEKAALDLSNKVNRLAVDLASFTNYEGGAERASLALTKAILGETESAKALGIVLRQGTKEFKDNVDALMKNEKMSYNQAMAVTLLNDAYKQSNKAVGDFARTSNSTANQERILEENTKKLYEASGKMLAPAYTSLVKLANKFVTALVPVNSEVKDEAIQVNRLATMITNSNTSQEDRVRYYEELQKIAPSVIKDIDKENISMGKLATNLGEYNKHLVTRIMLERNQAKIADVLNRQADAQISASEKQANAIDLITSKMIKLRESGKTGLADEIGSILSGGGSIQEKIRKVTALEGIREMERLAGSFDPEMKTKGGDNFTQTLLAMLSNLNSFNRDYSEALREYEALSGVAKNLTDELGGYDPGGGGTDDGDELISGVTKTVETLGEMKKRLEDLKTAKELIPKTSITEITKAQQEINKLAKEIERLDKLGSEGIGNLINPLLKLQAEIDKLEQKKLLPDSTAKDLEDANLKLRTMREELEKINSSVGGINVDFNPEDLAPAEFDYQAMIDAQVKRAKTKTTEEAISKSDQAKEDLPKLYEELRNQLVGGLGEVSSIVSDLLGGAETTVGRVLQGFNNVVNTVNQIYNLFMSIKATFEAINTAKSLIETVGTIFGISGSVSSVPASANMPSVAMPSLSTVSMPNMRSNNTEAYMAKATKLIEGMSINFATSLNKIQSPVFEVAMDGITVTKKTINPSQNMIARTNKTTEIHNF